MGGAGYRTVLRVTAVREALVLGTVIRVPMWAAGVALTLHVVGDLQHSYAQAGLVDALFTLGIAIGGPWRGRRLDQVGLRRSLLPSLLTLPLIWSVAPMVPYVALLPLVFLGGLMTISSFAIVRQILIGATSAAQRKTVLSLDAVTIEVTFMIGPVLGVLGATTIGAGRTVLLAMWLVVLGGLALFVRNPAVTQGDEEETPHEGGWLTPSVLAILAAAVTASLVLTGGDLGVVAAMRAMQHTGAIGLMLALWGLGSAIGGLVYGALHRSVSGFALLALLAATSIPVSLAGGPLVFGALLLVTGLFCAPTLTALVDQLSHAVPASRRGEAMGWHGSAMTAGGALGAPAIGWAIDAQGWPAGFVLAGGLGLVVALIGSAMVAVRRRRARAAATGPAAVQP